MKEYLSKGSSNSKTKKNVRDTLILYMSPAKQNSIGRNLCPKASAGCLASCLYTAGRGAFGKVQKARTERTEMWIHQPDIMLYSIAKQINKRALKVSELAVRLNGTSDTNIVDRLLNRHAIAENVLFYDYTKIRERSVFKDTLPNRYVVTFSRSEDNEHEALDVLASGGIVAVVFDKLPDTWHGYPVVDGDERDDLMLDIDGGTVLGLKAKGRAKKDQSGFVIKTK